MSDPVTIDLDELIPEKQLADRLPNLFKDGPLSTEELRQARKAGTIGHIKLSSQKILYRRADIEDYMRRHYQAPEPCPNDSSNTPATGSPPSQGAPGSTDIGLKDAVSAARNLWAQHSTKPKPHSSHGASNDQQRPARQRPSCS